MSAQTITSHLNNWATIRLELLNTSISKLGLKLEGSRLEPLVKKLYRELAARHVRYRPPVYLTDTWGCPDEVPVIGVPFYLADPRLMRIEEEQTGRVEDARTTLMLLRHEAGHAINYAYRLWETPEWTRIFGHFFKPYRETFQPQPHSRQFVRHVHAEAYGTTYAQKHPDEDFAETFAVWLTPRSSWRRKYRGWPAMAKLRYVDRVMRKLRKARPLRSGGRRLNPANRIRLTLAEHYGQRAELYRTAAQGYMDDDLHASFPALSGPGGRSVAALLRRHRRNLIPRLTRWSGLPDDEVRAILAKLEKRAQALKVEFDPDRTESAVLDLGAMATALTMDYAYTGQFV
jgi:hypothetical protein